MELGPSTPALDGQTHSTIFGEVVSLVPIRPSIFPERKSLSGSCSQKGDRRRCVQVCPATAAQLHPSHASLTDLPLPIDGLKVS